jgi:hypothetical protein
MRTLPYRSKTDLGVVEPGACTNSHRCRLRQKLPLHCAIAGPFVTLRRQMMYRRERTMPPSPAAPLENRMLMTTDCYHATSRLRAEYLAETARRAKAGKRTF